MLVELRKGWLITTAVPLTSDPARTVPTERKPFFDRQHDPQAPYRPRHCSRFLDQTKCSSAPNWVDSESRKCDLKLATFACGNHPCSLPTHRRNSNAGPPFGHASLEKVFRKGMRTKAGKRCRLYRFSLTVWALTSKTNPQ